MTRTNSTYQRISKRGLALIISVIILVLLVIGLIIFFGKRNHPTDTYGNTTGNIANGGLFCEYGDYIYFSNPQDHNYLYRMNKDGSNPVLLNKDTIQNINVYNNTIYYTKSTTNIAGGKSYGISCCNLKGNNVKELTNEIVIELMVYDNALFYKGSDDKTYNYVFSYGINNNKKTKISKDAFSVADIWDGKLYYADVNGPHNIISYDIKDRVHSTHLKANAYMVDMNKDYLYYIDLENNYSLVRTGTIGNAIEVLYQGTENAKCITYNHFKDVIYFFVQGEDGSALYRMKDDGSELQFLLSANIESIHCTSTLTFATIYNSKQIYVFETLATNPEAKLLKVQ